MTSNSPQYTCKKICCVCNLPAAPYEEFCPVDLRAWITYYTVQERREHNGLRAYFTLKDFKEHLDGLRAGLDRIAAKHPELA